MTQNCYICGDIEFDNLARSISCNGEWGFSCTYEEGLVRDRVKALIGSEITKNSCLVKTDKMLLYDYFSVIVENTFHRIWVLQKIEGGLL